MKSQTHATQKQQTQPRPIVQALISAGLVSVSTLTLIFTSTAHAQQPPTAAKENPNKLEEIVVTAQKRPETVQKTPLAITAISGDDIREAGIRNVKDISGAVPNVQINQNGAATEIAIRGITSTNNTEIGDPAAGFHVDGVFFGRPEAAGAAFYDVARVEVLRGPQGTLWGRNTTAGSINVITNKPGAKREGSLNLDFGNYSSLRSEGMLNLPLTESVAIRGAFTTEEHKGYLNTENAAVNAPNNNDDAKDSAGRVHLSVKPNQQLNMLFTVDTYKQSGVGYGAVPLPLLADKGWDGRRAPANVQSATDNQFDGYSGEINYDTGPATLTYVGAKRKGIRNELNTVSANTARTQFNGEVRQATHEFRLASNGAAPLTWVLGAFSYKENNNVLLRAFNVSGVGLPPGFGLGFIQPFVESKSTAYFGQASYALSDAFKITAGLRSTKDSKSRRGVNTLMLPSGADLRNLSVNDASVESSKINGRLALDFAVNKSTLLYASVATGYKAGGFIDGTKTVAFDNTFKPENVTTFEGGLKSRMLDGTLQTNFAVFSSDFKDFQVSYRGQLPGGPVGTFVTLVNNAGEASISGAEAEVRWLVGGGTLDASLALLKTNFDRFESPPEAATVFSNTGKQLVKAPKASGSLGYQYGWSVMGGELIARVATRYSAKYFLQPTNIALTEQKSFTKTDLTLTYVLPKDTWTVQAYVKNLENKNVVVGLGGLTAPTGFLAPPRTYGIRVGMKF